MALPADGAAGRDWFLGMQLAWRGRVAKSISSFVAGVERRGTDDRREQRGSNAFCKVDAILLLDLPAGIYQVDARIPLVNFCGLILLHSSMNNESAAFLGSSLIF
jgi:hypothetical protein